MKTYIIKSLNTLKDISDRYSKMYKLGVDLIEYEEPYHIVINDLFKCLFDETGYDLISWWLYENVNKIIYEKDGTETDLNSVEKFVDYLLLWYTKVEVKNDEGTEAGN